MTTTVIPVRSFRLGKKRLSTVLTDEQRHRIGTALAKRVIETTLAAGLTPLIVTADEEVQTWAVIQGVATVNDPGLGLNSAVATGVATVSGDRWLVVHSDLPILRSIDLDPILAAIEAGRDVIAPSSDGGTSAISATGTIEFAYGEASFHTHLPRLSDPVVVATAGLLHDLDSPDDLESARRQKHGRWLDGIY